MEEMKSRVRESCGVADQSPHLGLFLFCFFFFIKEMRNHQKVLSKRRVELNSGFKNVFLTVYRHLY